MTASRREASSAKGPWVPKKGHSEQDTYLRLLSQFYAGVFTETLKTSPVTGTLGRSYLRIAWIFRDVVKEFTECLKALIRKSERLIHLKSVNFALLSPNLPEHQLRKRADGLHKELTSRRFTLNGNALSIGVSIEFSTIQSYTGTPKSLQEGLYKRPIQALDNAKTKGNQIEYIQQN